MAWVRTRMARRRRASSEAAHCSLRYSHSNLVAHDAVQLGEALVVGTHRHEWWRFVRVEVQSDS